MTVVNTSITVIQQDAAFGPGAASDLLVGARLVRVYDGDPVPSVDDVAGGLVVLGGGVGVHEQDAAAWLAPVRDLMAGALAAEAPVLAIGLGAQLLAQAGGGHVQVDAPPGLECGPVQLFWRRGALEDPVLAAVVSETERTMLAVACHRDAVAELPPTAQWLASSELYPFQAFRIGSGLGLQFQPEATAELVERWTADLDEDEREAQRAAFAESREGIEQHGVAILTAFVESVARDTMPA
ncbi:GMP synthase (glutamine-hydrolysing) [Paraoerskovia marina]|uniref:GMP synthase (Glutamine-hydrolysing) n=1 Tax=Paraoerskovia marina TaxID=545619 RepID=A0A1H1Q4I5_9CELL|nr:GMP synthase (glutamine-hydrolysing) [Paraoerskovia marina]